MPALSAAEIRDYNTRYHDVAAEQYDAKWGIDFGQVGQAQVLGKLHKALGSPPGRYERSLEIGAGTGYFTLNLMQSGVVVDAVCCDISAGMLATLEANARRLDLPVSTVVCDAERLPFDSGSFDLVFGHAVLHHIPRLERAFAEFHRVLRPGGMLVFAGEPSHHGDRLAALPKRGAHAIAPLWRRLMGASQAQHPGGHGGADPELEGVVDVHAFTPPMLVQAARAAGFEGIRVHGEELLASWFGWANRALESTAEPAEIPWAWRQYAYRGYLMLQRVDQRVLEPRLPPAIFYNLMLAARRPADQASARSA
jgi:ubiquinone/menaquinone biosynthesis C-methylase UbiE